MLKWDIPEANEEPVRLSKRFYLIVLSVCLGAFTLSLLSWFTLLAGLSRYDQTLMVWSI